MAGWASGDIWKDADELFLQVKEGHTPHGCTANAAGIGGRAVSPHLSLPLDPSAPPPLTSLPASGQGVVCGGHVQ